MEKLSEGRAVGDGGKFVATVEIDDLAEEGDFPDALGDEGFDLGDDFGDGAGALSPARARDDAEGAVHIAALHDGDEGADLFGREKMVADGVLGAGFLGDVDDALGLNSVTALAEEFVDVAAGFVKLLGADDEIDIGQVVEDRGAPALGHATEKSDDLVL